MAGPSASSTAAPPHPSVTRPRATATCTLCWTTTPRLAYTEILTDERKQTAAAFLHRAHAWYTARGITIERILSDNGGCYRSRDWAAACAQLHITHKRTRPYRPQTNGKIERYHRTLADEWAYTQPYASETQRQATLPDWLHQYNNHRGHTALGGHPPAASLTSQVSTPS